jgi:hypothetical protein
MVFQGVSSKIAMWNIFFTLGMVIFSSNFDQLKVLSARTALKKLSKTVQLWYRKVWLWK